MCTFIKLIDFLVLVSVWIFGLSASKVLRWLPGNLPLNSSIFWICHLHFGYWYLSAWDDRKFAFSHKVSLSLLFQSCLIILLLLYGFMRRKQGGRVPWPPLLWEKLYTSRKILRFWRIKAILNILLLGFTHFLFSFKENFIRFYWLRY